MYKQVKIQKLSPTQLRNLLKGSAVRIKRGGALSVNLSPEQLKKLDRAHAKDRAVQVMFDPYQIQMHGGSFKGDMENFYNKHIPQSFHPGIESVGKATLSELGFGLKKKRGRPKKTGGSLKSEMEKFYNEKIPQSFHPGLESLGSSAIKEFGFGLKKRGRPKKTKGKGIFKDIGKIAGKAFQEAAPVLKPIAKQVAKEVVKYGAQAAGPAAAAAAIASGNPQLAPFAGMAGQMIANKAEAEANRLISGLGVKTMGKPYGRRSRGSALHAGALYPAGFKSQ